MLTFSAYFVLVINGNQINGFHLFWDTLYKTFRPKEVCSTNDPGLLQPPNPQAFYKWVCLGLIAAAYNSAKHDSYRVGAINASLVPHICLTYLYLYFIKVVVLASLSFMMFLLLPHIYLRALLIICVFLVADLYTWSYFFALGSWDVIWFQNICSSTWCGVNVFEAITFISIFQFCECRSLQIFCTGYPDCYCKAATGSEFAVDEALAILLDQNEWFFSVWGRNLWQWHNFVTRAGSAYSSKDDLAAATVMKCFDASRKHYAVIHYGDVATARSSTLDAVTEISRFDTALANTSILDVAIQFWVRFLALLHRQVWVRFTPEHLSGSLKGSWMKGMDTYGQPTCLFDILCEVHRERLWEHNPRQLFQWAPGRRRKTISNFWWVKIF